MVDNFGCDYELDPESDHDFNNCPSCIHDRNKDCRFGIYLNSIIEFLPTKEASDEKK